jgi:hypothetical protein
MGEEKREAMCFGILNGARFMIEVQRFRGAGRRAVSGVFGVVKEWGKRRSSVPVWSRQ